MHSASSRSRHLDYLPSVYTTVPHFSDPCMGSHHRPGGTMTNTSWERRYMRKHRRKSDDEGSSGTKRQKLMEEEEEVEAEPAEYSCSEPSQSDMAECSTSSLPCSAPVPPCPQPRIDPLLTARVEPESSCMEVEAAQRRLQEIEDRITLEDDSDEDLDVEPAQRRPVLVLSDSLREGLQRGIADILPHTVAQSVSRSCMELVLWRPLEDPLTQQLKDSLQRQQRKQQPVCRQTPTPIPSTSQGLSGRPDEQVFSSLYRPPVVYSATEEDMEL